MPAFVPTLSNDPPSVQAMSGQPQKVQPPGPWPYASASQQRAVASSQAGSMASAAVRGLLPGGVAPLPIMQAFRDYGATYQATMSRAGAQIGGAVANDYLLKERLYGILLAPTLTPPKARLTEILGR